MHIAKLIFLSLLFYAPISAANETCSRFLDSFVTGQQIPSNSLQETYWYLSSIGETQKAEEVKSKIVELLMSVERLRINPSDWIVYKIGEDPPDWFVDMYSLNQSSDVSTSNTSLLGEVDGLKVMVKFHNNDNWTRAIEEEVSSKIADLLVVKAPITRSIYVNGVKASIQVYLEGARNYDEFVDDIISMKINPIVPAGIFNGLDQNLPTQLILFNDLLGITDRRDENMLVRPISNSKIGTMSNPIEFISIDHEYIFAFEPNDSNIFDKTKPEELQGLFHDISKNNTLTHKALSDPVVNEKIIRILIEAGYPTEYIRWVERWLKKYRELSLILE